jgi:hypothetical protein
VTSFFEFIKNDGLVKSRHSRVGGNPESAKLLKRLDSRFHGNDGKEHIHTFYEVIKNKKQKERKRWLKNMCIFLEQEKRMGPPRCARFWVARAAIWRK